MIGPVTDPSHGSLPRVSRALSADAARLDDDDCVVHDDPDREDETER